MARLAFLRWGNDAETEIDLSTDLGRIQSAARIPRAPRRRAGTARPSPRAASPSFRRSSRPSRFRPRAPRFARRAPSAPPRTPRARATPSSAAAAAFSPPALPTAAPSLLTYADAACACCAAPSSTCLASSCKPSMSCPFHKAGKKKARTLTWVQAIGLSKLNCSLQDQFNLMSSKAIISNLACFRLCRQSC